MKATIEKQEVLDQPRHAAMVRVTHWIYTFTFLALLISGVAILMAHPHLYWGETGAFGTPALIDLPIPLNTDQSGWGRSLHFLAAWIGLLIVRVLDGSFPQPHDTDVQCFAAIGVPCGRLCAVSADDRNRAGYVAGRHGRAARNGWSLRRTSISANHPFCRDGFSTSIP